MSANNFLLAFATLGCFAACKAPPRFHQTTLLASDFDAGYAATKVTMQFELRCAEGLPIGDLQAESLTVREDGILATSESNLRLQATQHPIRIALLLDRSDSLQNGDSIARIKAAAQAVIDELAGHPCEVQVYSFANSVEQLPGIAQFATAAGDSSASRWTALYHTINTVLNDSAFGSSASPSASTASEATASEATATGASGIDATRADDQLGVLVICTDGADNYSQNFQSPTLADLERFIRTNHVIVHTLGFGNVAKEQDRQGIFGVEALRRLAVHGSYHDAAEPTAVPDLTAHILRRIRTTYSCTFYSPSLSGEHELTMAVNYRGSHSVSAPIRFTANGKPAAAKPSGQ